MYIHIGKDVVVQDSDIIGIFDLDNATVSKRTREFLNINEKKGNVVNVAEDLPKTFIICKKNSNTVIYLSQISSSTLRRKKYGQ